MKDLIYSPSLRSRMEIWSRSSVWYLWYRRIVSASITAVTETDTTKGECTYYHQERIKLDYVMQNGFISREIIDKDTIPYRYELIKSQKRN